MSQKRYKRSSRKSKKSPVLIPLLLGMGGLLLITLAAISLLSSKTPGSYTPEVTGGPSLKVDQEKIDLGDVPLGQTVRVSFELTNSGDRPLRFTKAPYIEVAAGC